MSKIEVKVLHVVIVVGLTVAAVAVAITLALQGNTVTVTPNASPQAKAAASSPASPAVKAQATLPCPPPPGEGVVGACTPKPVQVFGSRGAVPKVVPATVDPPVCIPDVSSWQGSVDWNAVKSWQLGRGCHPAGIFKMGEYVSDPWASHNNSELARLGMWRAGYWFLRRTGAAHEALQIVQAAHAYGLKVVVEDDESPEAAGYDGPVTAGIHALDPSLIVAEYASPGAYPGGTRSSNPAWIAAYGPANPPAAPWGGPIKAFQCSDGIFGCVTFVPGIGRDDVSVDFGITSLGVGPPPDPYAAYPKTVFGLRFGQKASEYGTVKAWDFAGCENVVVRAVCKSSRWHLQLLRDRIVWVAHHRFIPAHWAVHQHIAAQWITLKRPRYAEDHLGARLAGFEHRLTSPRGKRCSIASCG